MAQLWGGRFTKKTDQMVYDFNASISFDKRQNLLLRQHPDMGHAAFYVLPVQTFIK